MLASQRWAQPGLEPRAEDLDIGSLEEAGFFKLRPAAGATQRGAWSSMPWRQAVHARTLGGPIRSGERQRRESPTHRHKRSAGMTNGPLARMQKPSSVQRAALFVTNRFFPSSSILCRAFQMQWRETQHARPLPPSCTKLATHICKSDEHLMPSFFQSATHPSLSNCGLSYREITAVRLAGLNLRRLSCCYVTCVTRLFARFPFAVSFHRDLENTARFLS